MGLTAATLLLTLVTTAGGGSTDATGESEWSVWTYPVAILVGAADRDPGFFVPIGVTVRNEHRLELFGSVGFVYGTYRSDALALDFREQRGLLAEAGTTFRTAGEGGVISLWISPKLYYAVIAEDAYGESFPGSTAAAPEHVGVAHAAHLGIDLGVDVCAGPVVLTALVGASAGACVSCSQVAFLPIVPAVNTGGSVASPSRKVTPSASINLNLLRAGVTF